MTVKDCIERLQKLPQDAPVYFDCPKCGHAGIFGAVSQVVLVKTILEKP